jgi:uncharacterized membrane protein YoaK (UPF0700 family)
MMRNLYISFMSGNTTALGRALAAADWSRAGLITEIITAFVAGVVAGTVFATLAGVYRLPAVTLAVGIILAFSDPLSQRSVPYLTFAMGALNAALQQVGGMAISITYVTGTLVRLGLGIGLFLCGDTGDWRWVEQATLWSALLLGVAGTAMLEAAHPTAIRVALPIAALAVSLTTFATIVRTDHQTPS